MQAQLSAPAVPALFDANLGSAEQAAPELPQDVWIRRCLARLRQLRPQGEPGLEERVAGDLWHQVSRFNPEIAAELEHESADLEH